MTRLCALTRENRRDCQPPSKQQWVKAKETVGNSLTVLSYFGSQRSSQSLNLKEVIIYRLEPKSAAKGEFFRYFCL